MWACGGIWSSVPTGHATSCGHAHSGERVEYRSRLCTVGRGQNQKGTVPSRGHMSSRLPQRPVNGEREPASQSGGSQGTSGPQSSCRGPRFNSVGDPPWGLHAPCFSHGSLLPRTAALATGHSGAAQPPLRSAGCCSRPGNGSCRTPARKTQVPAPSLSTQHSRTEGLLSYWCREQHTDASAPSSVCPAPRAS